MESNGKWHINHNKPYNLAIQHQDLLVFQLLFTEHWDGSSKKLAENDCDANHSLETATNTKLPPSQTLLEISPVDLDIINNNEFRASDR